MWQDLIKDDLTNRGPAPSDYIPGKMTFSILMLQWITEFAT